VIKKRKDLYPGTWQIITDQGGLKVTNPIGYGRCYFKKLGGQSLVSVMEHSVVASSKAFIDPKPSWGYMSKKGIKRQQRMIQIISVSSPSSS
jgi:hypothetical protein